MIAKRVFFFGRVQGVGFRYTVVELLRNLPLAGFVRNCMDGSVELFLQGPSEDVRTGIDRIYGRWGSQVERFTEKEETPGDHPAGIKIFK